jgi:hypothetical protein
MANGLQVTQPYGHSEFVQMALLEFPELREEFEDFDGLLHVQMGAFARLVQGAKGQAAWDVYERAVRLADTLWTHADPSLQNALNVSFLENIDFEGSRGRTAWGYLSPSLRVGWRLMKEYNELLAAPPKKERGKHL